MGWNLRRIGKGFVVHVRQARDDIERVLCTDVKFKVVSAEVACHCCRMRGFIVSILGETDGEGFHRPRALRLHQGDDGRRVDAAGQKGAQRHIGNHLSGDRRAKFCAKRVDCIVNASGKRRVLTGRCNFGSTPIRNCFGQDTACSASRQCKDGPGQQFAHACVNRMRRRDIRIAQK